MKIIKSKRKIYNPVTGTYYSLYERKSDPTKPPIRGLWRKKNGRKD
jgi:hypothetical protein